MVELPEQLNAQGMRFVKIKEGEKAPFEKNWQSETNYDYNDIMKWNGNYGVVCGYGDLVVIDGDNEITERAVEKNLPETFTVQSGSGGKHYYYICKDLDKSIRLKQEEYGDLGDVQHKGKQVVGPGSLHPNGKHYQVLVDKEIEEITPEQIKFALKDLIKDDSTKKVLEEEKERAREQNLRIDLNVADVVNLSNLRKRGDEYQGPNPVHGSNTGMNFCVNTRKNVWHCFRKNCDSGGGPLSWVAVKEGIIDCGEAKPGELKGRKFKDVLRILKNKYGIEINHKEEIENPKKWDDVLEVLKANDLKKSKKLDKVATFILNNYNIKTIVKSESMYVYQNPIYENTGKEFSKNLIWKNLGGEILQNDVKNILDEIKSMTYIQANDLGIKGDRVVLKNGVYDLNEDEILEHSPQFNALKELNVEFDENADCPKFKEYLNNNLPNENEQILLQELLGTALVNKKLHKKGGMIVGPTDSGKSTLLNIIKGVFGKDNISDQTPHALAHERWAKAEIFGKYMNMSHEVDGSQIKRLDLLKKIMAGDMISAEKKGRDPFSFNPTCEHIYATNVTPNAKRKDDAFWNRWIILEMPYTVKKENQIEGLDNQIINEESSGILNWIIEGYKKFKENGNKFSVDISWEETRNKWLNWGDSIERFIQNCLEKSSGNKISSEEIYDKYVEYCSQHDLDQESQINFTKRLKEISWIEYSNRFVIDGKKQRGFKNVSVLGDEGDKDSHLFNIYSSSNNNSSYNPNKTPKNLYKLSPSSPKEKNQEEERGSLGDTHPPESVTHPSPSAQDSDFEEGGTPTTYSSNKLDNNIEGGRQKSMDSPQEIKVGDVRDVSTQKYCNFFSRHSGEIKQQIWDGEMWINVCDAHLEEAKNELR